MTPAYARFPDDMYRQLTAQAAAEGSSRTEVIRRAVRRYLDNTPDLAVTIGPAEAELIAQAILQAIGR